MKDAVRMAFVLVGGLCAAATILVFSAGMLRYHMASRKDYRYDVEFDRARRDIVSMTLYTGMVLLAAFLAFMALARWCR